ncbi:MAG: putative acetyltransferase [Granulosicoccus sp.]|jgi:putative acetyltransferase
MQIIVDDLEGQPIIELLAEHLQDMQSLSPPESAHALDIEALKAPDITFWSAWQDEELLGCGALKEISSTRGEIKSMRTASAHHRKGVASMLVNNIIEISIERGYKQLYLETGSMVEFEAARLLYTRFGFSFCPPFSDYEEDPDSLFMMRQL